MVIRFAPGVLGLLDTNRAWLSLMSWRLSNARASIATMVGPYRDITHHWNGYIMLIKFSPLAVPEVVILTTSGATIEMTTSGAVCDENFTIVIFSYQCIGMPPFWFSRPSNIFALIRLLARGWWPAAHLFPICHLRQISKKRCMIRQFTVTPLHISILNQRASYISAK